MRREMQQNATRRVADDSWTAIAALRESLDKLHWAWPTKKRAIAEEVLREPCEVGDVPKPSMADLARKLVRQVDEAIAKVRERLTRDPSHDWVARAHAPSVREAVLTAVKVLCSYDEDRASLDNGIGWRKSHSHAGHVLGSLTKLSVIEASQVLAAVWRHQKQVRPELRAAIFGSAEA